MPTWAEMMQIITQIIKINFLSNGSIACTQLRQSASEKNVSSLLKAAQLAKLNLQQELQVPDVCPNVLNYQRP